MNTQEIEEQSTHIRGVESWQSVIIEADDDETVALCVFTRGAHVRSTFTKEQAQAMIKALQRAVGAA